MRQSLIDHFDKRIGLSTGMNLIATAAVDALVEWLRDNHKRDRSLNVYEQEHDAAIRSLADLLEAP